MSSTQIKPSVIILTYNSKGNIGKCLKSLENEKSLIEEVIVVDNRSTDTTLAEIKKSRIVTRLIVNERNTGFSKGVNKGIMQARGELVLILNPDTIIERGAFQQLFKCLRSTKADIIGGKALKTDGGIHNTYVREPGLLTGIFDFTNLRKIVPSDYFHKVHYYLNNEFPTEEKEVDAVSGAFMMVKRGVFEEIGLFDENFFMYLEDVDFCSRAKKKGFKVVFCPMARVIHVGGASSNNKDKINHMAWSNSRKYYFKKHFSKIQNTIVQPLFIIDDVLTRIWQRLKSR